MTCLSAVELAAHESFERMLESIKRGAFKKHTLTSSAIPFAWKQGEYLAGYNRLLKSRNFNYIVGESEEKNDQTLL